MSVYRLTLSSPAVRVGDVVCAHASQPVTVAKALPDALARAGAPLGIALRAALPGQKVAVADSGLVDREVTGLAAGPAMMVIVAADGRVARSAAPGPGESVLGACSVDGVVTIHPRPPQAISGVSGAAVDPALRAELDAAKAALAVTRQDLTALRSELASVADRLATLERAPVVPVDGGDQGPVMTVRPRGTGLVLADGSPFANTGDQTVEMWVRLDAVSQPRSSLFYKRIDIEGYFYVLPDGRLVFHTGNRNGSDSIGTATEMPLILGTWYHVAAVLDRTNGAIRLYRDGQPCALTMGVTPLGVGPFLAMDYFARNPAAPLHIGSDPWGLAHNGLVREVRVWHVARTEAQIQAAMRRGLDDAERALVRGYWKLGEGTGETAFDSSGSGHHLHTGTSSWEQENHA